MERRIEALEADAPRANSIDESLAFSRQREEWAVTDLWEQTGEVCRLRAVLDRAKRALDDSEAGRLRGEISSMLKEIEERRARAAEFE
jgi:hypothetical protein